jgi:hypothetical protein
MVTKDMTSLHIPIDRSSILYVTRSYVYFEVLSINSERLGRQTVLTPDNRMTGRDDAALQRRFAIRDEDEA